MSDVEPTLAESGIGRVVDASEPVIDHDGALSPRAAGGEGPVEELRRRRLFDLDFVDAPSLEPVLSSLLERRRPADDSRMETVLTPNVDIMVHLTQPGAEGSLEWRMFQHSQYCLPDGQPIVLASRLLGRPLSSRLTGSGLFALLWPRLVTDRRAVFMVASSRAIVERLEREYDELRSTVAPMFGVDDVETIDGLAAAVIEAARERALEYVILGIGNPKDARIAESILRLWPSTLGRPPTLLALGGSASMYVGITKRAPEWVQRIGMEWFYRFLQEPRRLFHRYFVRDLAFVRLVWRQWRADRRADPIVVSRRPVNPETVEREKQRR
ncbi:MAG: WecB/TagA/CpsF family glycosyltransferase [Acidimicrobiia bacterium]|nr:WecB/TagA/CpsF family glycosyltransferase [Acidimicrobiia bacterium]